MSCRATCSRSLVPRVAGAPGLLRPRLPPGVGARRRPRAGALAAASMRSSSASSTPTRPAGHPLQARRNSSAATARRPSRRRAHRPTARSKATRSTSRSCSTTSSRAASTRATPAPLADLELPDSLQSLILGRIDQLDEAPRRTLKVASVLGRVFNAPGPARRLPGDRVAGRRHGSSTTAQLDLDRARPRGGTGLPLPARAHADRRIREHAVRPALDAPSTGRRGPRGGRGRDRTATRPARLPLLAQRRRREEAVLPRRGPPAAQAATRTRPRSTTSSACAPPRRARAHRRTAQFDRACPWSANGRAPRPWAPRRGRGRPTSATSTSPLAATMRWRTPPPGASGASMTPPRCCWPRARETFASIDDAAGVADVLQVEVLDPPSGAPIRRTPRPRALPGKPGDPAPARGPPSASAALTNNLGIVAQQQGDNSAQARELGAAGARALHAAR